MKQIRVNIIGCCISRDIFGITKTDLYKVNKYYQWNSVLSLIGAPPNETYHVSESDFPDIKQKFVKRCACNNINKTVLNEITSDVSDWLVIDFFAEMYPTYRLEYPDGHQNYYSVNDELHNSIASLIQNNDRYRGCKLERCDPTYAELRNAVKKFAKIIKDSYGGRIIVIAARQAYEYVSNYGLHYFENKKNYMIQNEKIRTIESLFLNEIECES